MQQRYYRYVIITYSALDEKMNVVFSTYTCFCSNFVYKYSKICYKKYL